MTSPLLTIKIDGSRAISVDFLDHHVQLLVRELVVQLPQDLAKTSGGDVSVALLVVQPERLLQLLLHGLVVLLHYELSRERDELLELQPARLCNLGLKRRAPLSTVLTVGVDLLDQLLQDFLVEGLPHEAEDVGDHVGGDAARLLVVEGFESLAQDWTIINNALVRIWRRARIERGGEKAIFQIGLSLVIVWKIPRDVVAPVFIQTRRPNYHFLALWVETFLNRLHLLGVHRERHDASNFGVVGWIAEFVKRVREFFVYLPAICSGGSSS
jgi:hypothetical protein